MSRVLEVNEQGALHVPPEVLGELPPHARYEVEVQGEVLILRPVRAPEPIWKTATPAERAAAFRQWAASHGPGVGLPDVALRREAIYE